MRNFKAIMKRSISVFLVMLMCLTATPLGQFAGLDIANLFATEASAASNSSDSEGTYWAMSHEEAINFIGFMYDKSKITEEMMNAGGVYTFLTGGFKKGSIEEYTAKLAFLITAKSNLSNCLSSYNQMANDAYQYLRDYFEDQLSIGAIAESTAWDIADEIVDYCDEIIEEYTEGAASISAECLSLKSAYSNVSNALDVIEALIVGIGGLNYVWSNSKKDMYTYVSSYISNRSLKNSCSEAFDLINDYNKFALTDGFDYDFILDWASDDHIATLERFGDYIYFVSKSFNYKGSVFDPTDDLSEYKVIDVQCPTNVYIYNKNKELLLSIIDNNIVNNSTNISASVYDNKKRIALPLVCEYDVVIEGTDEGTMDYFIYEVFNDSIMRTIEHNSVPLTEGCEYTTSIPAEVYNNIDEYNLINETGEEIKADYDSLPPIEDNIVDVVVAEELFDGFPKEVVERVANTMFNMESVADLSDYDISIDDAVALFSAVAKYYPVEYTLITTGDFTYKIIVSPNLDRIMKIRFYYGDDANLSTYQKRVNDLNAEINALVTKVGGMNEFEKALYVHDYIVLNCEYDLEFLEQKRAQGGYLTTEQYQEKYSEYSILVNGTGLCGSYALAYRAVLNAAGMECLYLSSTQMNHAWNLVKIDGNWYHVDCCWDDPVPDTYGRANRTYFLRTDSEIMQLNHYNWSPGQYKAASEKYSDMPRGYDINQKYDNGKWYYISGTTLYSSDEYGKNETEITSMSASSIDVDDNSVYFSTGRYIYEYDMETREKNLVYMLSEKDSGDRIENAYLSNIYIDDENVEFYKSIHKDDKRIIVFDADSLQREKFASITGFEISQTTAEVDVFETLKLNAEIITTGSTDDLKILWTSSDETIATVSDKGLVTAKNVGTVIITATCLEYSASCTLTVTGNGLSGMCGDTAIWKFDAETKTLTISGSGEISTFAWEKFAANIYCIVIENGIESLPSQIFNNCTNLKVFAVCNENCEIDGYVNHANADIIVVGKENSTAQIYADLYDKDFAIFDNHCSAEFENYKIAEKEDGFTGDIVCPECNSVLYQGKVLHLSDNNNDSKCDFCNESIEAELNIILESDGSNWPRYWINGAKYYISLNCDVDLVYDSSNYCITKLTTIPEGVTVNLNLNGYVLKCNYLAEDADLNINIDYAYPATEKKWGMITNNGTLNINGDNGTIVNFLCNYNITDKRKKIDNGIGKLGTIVNKGNLYIDKTTINTYNTVAINNGSLLSSAYVDLFLYGASVFNEGTLYAQSSNIDCGVMTAGISASRTNSYHYAIAYGIYGGDVILKNCKVNAEAYSGALWSTNNCAENNKIVEFAVGIYSNNLIIDGDSEISATTKFWQDRDGYDNLGTNISFATGILYNNDNYPIIAKDTNITADCFALVDGIVAIPGSEVWANTNSLFYSPVSIQDNADPEDEWARKAYAIAALKGNLMPTIGNQTSELIYSTYDIFMPSNNETIANMMDGKSAIADHSYYYGDPDGKSLYSIELGLNKNSGAYDYVEEFKEEYISVSLRNNDNAVCMHKTTESANAKNATCSNNGYTGDLICISCNAFVENGIDTPATGEHNYQLVSTTPGDCVTAPVMNYKCADCDATTTKTGKIDDGHKYVEVVIAPTCTANGYTISTCEICQETVIYDFTSPVGHDLAIKKSDSYCSAHDTIEYQCKKCDYSESIAADADSLETETVIVEATCTKSGSKSEICVLCHATVSTEIIRALSHDYSDEFTVDKNATCSENGIKSKHCLRCDVTKEVTEIPATGHHDENHDGNCDNCNSRLIGNCSCMCHKSGFLGFIWKIINFLYKIFGTNKTCDCGMYHY